jgi:hypothetical protein
VTEYVRNCEIWKHFRSPLRRNPGPIDSWSDLKTLKWICCFRKHDNLQASLWQLCIAELLRTGCSTMPGGLKKCSSFQSIIWPVPHRWHNDIFMFSGKGKSISQGWTVFHVFLLQLRRSLAMLLPEFACFGASNCEDIWEEMSYDTETGRYEFFNNR